MSSAEDLIAQGHLLAAERMLLELTRNRDSAGRAYLQLARLALLGPRGSARSAWRRVERARAAGLDSAGLHHVAAECRAQLGDLEGAVTHLRMAVARAPDDPELWSALGNALRRCERNGESLAAHREAVRLGPARATAWSNYAITLRETGDGPAALDAFARAVALRPDHASLRHNLGNAQLRAAVDDDELRAAASTLRDALVLDPSLVDARVDLATALRRAGAFEEALEQLQGAHRHAPDHVEARYNLALARLARGQRDGWAMYEARRALRGFPVRRPSVPDWMGEPHPAGHLWLSHEQGLGDAIQFCRFVGPAAARYGGRVTWTVPPRLVALFRSLTRVIPRLRIVADDTMPDVPQATHHLPLMSLPHALDFEGPAGPKAVTGPYLLPDLPRLRRWSRWLDVHAPCDSLRVGIAWQGNPRYAGDRHRSVSLARFAAMAALPGVRLFALQKGHGEQQMDQAGAPTVERLPEDADRDGAFVDTLALAGALDLVVSTDTAVLHVAAAAGASVFVPLAQRCDWRWGGESPSTPWYPGIHLFRQTRHGDWDEVFERITIAVQRSQACKYASTSAQAS